MNAYRKFGSIFSNSGIILSAQLLALYIEYDIEGNPLSFLRDKCLQHVKTFVKIFGGIAKKRIA